MAFGFVVLIVVEFASVAVLVFALYTSRLLLSSSSLRSSSLILPMVGRDEDDGVADVLVLGKSDGCVLENTVGLDDGMIDCPADGLLLEKLVGLDLGPSCPVG